VQQTYLRKAQKAKKPVRKRPSNDAVTSESWRADCHVLLLYFTTEQSAWQHRIWFSASVRRRDD